MKRTLHTLLFLFATIVLMAQNSFVVVDKNGKSQLVQSLIFQQDASNDRFSWNSNDDADGYQKGRDIKDLLYIARANSTLTTGTAEEVTQMLEELSGTDKADATTVAAVLQANPNVVEAFSEDGNNVAIREKADDGLRYYPLYSQEFIFSENELEESLARLQVNEKARKAPEGSSGRIAIFNFFNGNELYKAQNKVVGRLTVWFKEHGYAVDEYGPGAKNGEFTQNNLEAVCNAFYTYNVVFVFTHGALDDKGNPNICTHEYAEKREDGIVDPITNRAYKILSVRQTFNEVHSGCIVYLGACDSAPKDGFGTDEFNKYNTALVGWTGRTRWAQLHAALLFYYQLYGDYDFSKVRKALSDLDKQAKPRGSEAYENRSGVFPNDKSQVFNYSNDFTATAEERPVKDGLYKTKQNYKVKILSNLSRWSRSVKAYLENILTGEKCVLTKEIREEGDDGYPKYVVKEVQPATKAGSLKKTELYWDIPDLKTGIYILHIIINTTGEHIKLDTPIHKIKAEHYLEVGGDIVLAEDITDPVIFNKDGKPVDEISVAKGSSQTFSVYGYEGHSFTAVTLDTNVINLSLSGNKLTVTGVSEGTTYLGVQDEQNKQMAIAEVTVTAGGDTPGPGPGGDVTFYTACPDANHPHWIDLGIGTLWRCCNEGASTPEEYGGHYTFDQAQAYNPPSLDQFKALLNNCSSVWTTQNGVNGRKFTSKVNGGTIFLPAAGNVWDGESNDVGSLGYYWSSTPYNEYYAYLLAFASDHVGTTGSYSRSFGQSVRPVLKKSSPTLSVSTSSLSITAGETSIVNITSGSGEYGVTNLNSNIAKATLDGTRITVNAIAAGEAKIVVTDIQTKQEITIKITVTAKSSGDTPGPGGDVTAYTACPDANHPHWIDLGIGTQWRCCNEGASTPEEYGSYYTFDQAQAYNPPSSDQLEALANNCSYTWTTQNGVNGWKFTSKVNGGTIFLPAAGDAWDGELYYVGSLGYYWSSTPGGEYSAYSLLFYSGGVYADYDDRDDGRSVRPVR